MDITVKPALSVNVAECSGELRELTNEWTAKLATGNMTEMATIHCKIAKAVTSGRLNGHPAALGIMLGCIDQSEAEDRGSRFSKTLKGDLEQSIMTEAGLLLASNGANTSVLRSMGFSKSNLLRAHRKLDDLLSCLLYTSPSPRDA